MAIEGIAFSLITNLVSDALSSLASYTALPFLKNLKIKRRVEIATAEVVEPLIPFLANEGITEAQQELLFRVCRDELSPFAKHPEALFSGSLDGQKIFDNLYSKDALPQVIRDERLENLYTLLFPRVATLLCRIPAAVKEWEAHAWAESFSRLDDIAEELKQLFLRLDAADKRVADSGTGVLAVARRTLAQRVSMQVDLTGLRADKPVAGTMEDFFVHPELARLGAKGDKIVGTGKDSMREFTRRGKLALIFSDAGFGKSTWTRWLQKELLTSKWPGLAIRIELRQMKVDSLPAFQDLIRQNVTIHIAEDLTTQRIGEWIKDGYLQFLLDGFDEIAPENREAVKCWIEELQTAVTPCPIIVTSRPLTSDHLASLPKEWVRWNILPFDQPRILEYIGRWYAKVPQMIDAGAPLPPDTIAQQLANDPTIAPLTSNPLLLSTLLMVHHLDGSLPSGRAQLYRRYVDGMLGLWDDRRKVHASGVPLSVPEKKEILTALALHLHLTEREQIDECEAIEVTQSCLGNMQHQCCPQEVLATLRERSGLLVGPGTYCFVHKSVSEFFVAEAAVQGTYTDNNGKRIDRFCLFEHRKDDRWNVVTFLWAGLAPIADVESFIQQCSDPDDIALGYGIFHDQYERFSRQIRRDLMLRLLRLKPRLSIGSHVWLVSGRDFGSRKGRLNIPTATLRGVRQSGLAEIFFRAAEDGTLTWSDSKGLRGNLHSLIWMSIAAFSRDVLDLERCIRQIPPDLQDAENWSWWLSDVTVGQALNRFENFDEAIKLIDVYAHCHSAYCGFLSIALLEEVVSYSLFPNRAPRYRHDFKQRVLGLIPSVCWDNIHFEFLPSTYTWVLHNANRDKVDLLKTALSVFESWQKESGVSSEPLKLAVGKVQGLIESRPSAEDSMLLEADDSREDEPATVR